MNGRSLPNQLMILIIQPPSPIPSINDDDMCDEMWRLEKKKRW